MGRCPGEKLYEELFHENEDLRQTGHEKIMLANHRPVDPAVLEQVLQDMIQSCQIFDEQALEAAMGRLVPERQRIQAPLPDNVIPFEQRQNA